MEIQGVDEENEISQLAQSNEESTIRIEDVRTLHQRKLEYCRLCAMPFSCTVSIFDKQGLEMNLANKINMNLPILVTEDSRLPLHVCWDCIKQLNASINFVSQCLRAQLKIERMFKDSLKGRHSTQMPIISYEKNVDAEERSSISRSVSNQLLLKEITSRDILGKNNDLSDVNLMDSSNLRKGNEEKRNGQSLSSKEMEHKEDEHISNKTLQKIHVLEISDSDNESSAAGNIMENTDKKSTKTEQNSHTSHDGFDLRNPENFIGVVKTKAQSGNSVFKRNKEMKYHCQYCKKSYNWKADLFRHQTSAHSDLVFCCCHCGKIFYESKEDFIRHENAHQMQPVTRNHRRSVKSNLSFAKISCVLSKKL